MRKKRFKKTYILLSIFSSLLLTVIFAKYFYRSLEYSQKQILKRFLPPILLQDDGNKVCTFKKDLVPPILFQDFGDEKCTLMKGLSIDKDV